MRPFGYILNPAIGMTWTNRHPGAFWYTDADDDGFGAEEHPRSVAMCLHRQSPVM